MGTPASFDFFGLFYCCYCTKWHRCNQLLQRSACVFNGLRIITRRHSPVTASSIKNQRDKYFPLLLLPDCSLLGEAARPRRVNGPQKVWGDLFYADYPQIFCVSWWPAKLTLLRNYDWWFVRYYDQDNKHFSMLFVVPVCTHHSLKTSEILDIAKRYYIHAPGVMISSHQEAITHFQYYFYCLFYKSVGRLLLNVAYTVQSLTIPYITIYRL